MPNTLEEVKKQLVFIVMAESDIRRSERHLFVLSCFEMNYWVHSLPDWHGRIFFFYYSSVLFYFTFCRFKCNSCYLVFTECSKLDVFNIETNVLNDNKSMWVIYSHFVLFSDMFDQLFCVKQTVIILHTFPLSFYFPFVVFFFFYNNFFLLFLILILAKSIDLHYSIFYNELMLL